MIRDKYPAAAPRACSRLTLGAPRCTNVCMPSRPMYLEKLEPNRRMVGRHGVVPRGASGLPRLRLKSIAVKAAHPPRLSGRDHHQPTTCVVVGLAPRAELTGSYCNVDQEPARADALLPAGSPGGGAWGQGLGRAPTEDRFPLPTTALREREEHAVPPQYQICGLAAKNSVDHLATD